MRIINLVYCYSHQLMSFLVQLALFLDVGIFIYNKGIIMLLINLWPSSVIVVGNLILMRPEE